MAGVGRKIEAKRAGTLVARVEPRSETDVGSAARAFGLEDDAEAFREVSREDAELVLTNVMHKDMAYSSEIMPRESAQELARLFLAEAGTQGARYFTNGSWEQVHKEYNGVNWNPLTDATFDTGVLVLSPERTACAWFVDED
jgi:hypothetical protein